MRHAIATAASKRLRTRAGDAGLRRQRGVYAIEFAFVFLLFFAVIYGIICYGLLFTFRAGLQNAAEEGARAALRVRAVSSAEQQSERRAAAKTVAESRLAGWLPFESDVQAEVCLPDTQVCSSGSSDAPCGADWSSRCQMVVTVSATGVNRMLPLLVFALPETLTGRASVLLDGRTM